MPQHDSQKVIEVVSNSSSQSPYSFHSLGLEQLLLQLALLRNVFSNQVQELQAAVLIAHRAPGEAHGDDRPVFAAPANVHPGLEVGHVVDEVNRFVEIGVDTRPSWDRKEFLGGSIAQHRNQRRVGCHNLAAGADTKDAIGRSFYHALVAHFGLAQGQLSAVLLGHIPNEYDHSENVAIAIAKGDLVSDY